MRSAKLALVSALAAVALGGCGAVAVKPAARTASGEQASRGRVDAPVNRAAHVQCLRAKGLLVRQLSIADLMIAGRIRVHFEPSPGTALGDQIKGRAQGAEVIGNALLYPGQASDAELSKVETCLDQGVKG
jgi:hypothetical protein